MNKKYVLPGLILVFVLVVVWLLKLMFYYGQPDFSGKITSYGVNMPEQYEVHGIDVSRYQQKINWNRVSNMRSNGIQPQFVFIKATESNRIVDDSFKYNWQLSKENGLLRGAYHYFTANDDVQKQAAFFCKNTSLISGDLPPVVDVEKLFGNKPADLRKKLKHFLMLLEKQYHCKPIIYTFTSFYRDFLGDEFNEYPLWVAHYFQPNSPTINRPWQFWQHTEQGRVDGIKSKVDLNVFNGTAAELNQLLIP